MIFRKNIQHNWLMRCASPSTPVSWRMMSWMDLTRVRTDILSSFLSIFAPAEANIFFRLNGWRIAFLVVSRLPAVNQTNA
jgi:hypothetical protein